MDRVLYCPNCSMWVRGAEYQPPKRRRMVAVTPPPARPEQPLTARQVTKEANYLMCGLLVYLGILFWQMRSMV